MENLTQHILYFVLGVAFFVYSFLYGPILGSGSVFPFIAKTDEERKAVLNSVAPFWDGAGVWLIAAAVVMWGAFPQSYSTIFGGFFLALFLLLLSFILSIASIELYLKDENRKNFWAISYFLGNLVATILLGAALGNVVFGIPLSEDLWYTGNFFTLLRPYPLLTALLGLTLIITHAMGYLLIKTEGIEDKVKKVLSLSNLAFLILFFIFFIYNAIIFKVSIWYWIVGVIIIALSLGLLFIRNYQFWISTFMILFSWFLVGLIQYPYVVRGLGNSGITLFDSSSPVTQKAMIFLLAIGLPFVILYTWYSYFVFRGKFSGKEKLY